MERKPQSLQNHTKFDPAFHFFLAPLSLVLLGSAIYYLYNNPGWTGAWIVIATIWGVVLLFKARLYSLKVQDRVIRLEERIRFQTLMGRIPELTEAQIIALRFACDSELAALAEQAASRKMSNKEIKQSIKTWRPDYWRV